MKQKCFRPEFQGRLLATCFGSVPVKFSQPLREDLDFCRVTSFSADFFISKFCMQMIPFPISVQLGVQPLLFLPAVGNRNNTNGTLNNQGTNGYYWSREENTANTNNAWNLNFNSTTTNVNNNNKANGFSVRCVAALNNANVFDFQEKLKYDLFQAYFDARKNKRNTWNQLRFEIEFEHNLLLMYEKILNRTYEIRKSIGFIVTKPVMREIFAADFSDRVIHHLIFNYINPILDKQFIPDSYSCRKGKGTLYGIERVSNFIKACSENYTKDCYIMKLDIKGYFMGMNKHLLIQKLHNMLDTARYTPFVPNESSFCWNDCFDFDLVWWLIEKVIWNDPTKSCIIKGKMSDWDGLPPSKSLFHSAPDCGLPIGNLTSQLFSNVYLHDFDCFVKNDLGIEYYGRYVDDFIMIHHDKAFLLDVLQKIKQYLVEHTQLQIHPNKVYLQHYSKGVSFLGAYIKPHRCYIAHRTKKNFYSALREVDGILSAEKVQREDLEKVRATLNSYLGIMKHYRTYNIKRKVFAKPHKLYKYGYLGTHYHKYCVYKKHLNR